MDIKKDIQEIKKMLITLSNDQSSMKQELMKEIKINREEIKSIDEKVGRVHSSLRYLEDDTPTLRDFKRLERRVTKIETKLATQ